jgi:hypothetical protein
MTGLSSKLVFPASALAAAVGMTLVSQQACTVLSNDEATCNECLFQQCKGEWAVCQQGTDCMAIYTCTVQPACIGSQPCIDGCIAAHPAGAAAFRVLTACDIAASCDACSSACSATCAPDAGAAEAAPVDAPPPPFDALVADAPLDGSADLDASFDAQADVPSDDAALADASDDSSVPDAGAPDASPGDAALPEDAGPTASVAPCNACVSGSCASQDSKCASGSSCDSYALCAAGCGSAACVSSCGTTYPSGTSDEGALSVCVVSSCASVCGY